MFTKTRVAVLRGGPSSEYEVSLKTGASLLSSLPEHCHPVDVFIDRAGVWHHNGRKDEPHKILSRVDVVLNALHGEYGENGILQHLLEAHGLSFSGSERFPSMLAMNKQMAKDIASKHGIRTPYFKVIRKEEAGDLGVLASELYRTFPQPSVIKPVAKGSSLGVSLARVPEEIAYALELAFQDSDGVLVEEYIEGTEAVCAVVEGYRGTSLYSLLPVEVILPSGATFLDYHGKHSGTATYNAPGNFSTEVKKALQDASKMVHRLLGLRHYSSSDFIVHPKRGIYFLEIDSLPALSPTATFSAGLQSVGSTLAHFTEHLVSLAQARK